MDKKSLRAILELKANADPGAVSAVFSTFGVVDSDGDIVQASAFTNGQQVPMTWSHDWSQPVGKGQILVGETQAVFDGQFFLETTAGLEAYQTVKALGTLQEWSWGFSVEDASFEQRAEKTVRVITKAHVYEVSPVLVGAGVGTYTLGIKSGLPYADEAEAALAAVQAVVTRSESLADLRRKEGRVLSDANRKRLSGLLESLDAVRTDIQDLLAATEPPKQADVSRLYAEYLRTMTTINSQIGA